MYDNTHHLRYELENLRKTVRWSNPRVTPIGKLSAVIPLTNYSALECPDRKHEPSRSAPHLPEEVAKYSAIIILFLTSNPAWPTLQISGRSDLTLKKKPNSTVGYQNHSRWDLRIIFRTLGKILKIYNNEARKIRAWRPRRRISPTQPADSAFEAGWPQPVNSPFNWIRQKFHRLKFPMPAHGPHGHANIININPTIGSLQRAIHIWTHIIHPKTRPYTIGST